MTTTDESSDAAPKWTRNEDRIICTRKSEAKSYVYTIFYQFYIIFLVGSVFVRSTADRSNHDGRWAEIGKELKRGRRECQQRHRALSSQAKELGITTAKLAKIYIEDDDDKSKPKKSAKDRDERTSKDNNEVKTDKLKAKHKGKSKDAANWDSKSETPPTSKTNKNKKQASETSSGSDSDPDSGSDSGPDDNDNDPEAEYWAQRRYIYDTQYSIMYPDQKVLRPDRFYSESDCRVLAGLEARYRANKWLYIQADFCNATGRMVEAEILKAKFYEDQNGGPFSSAPNG